MPKQAHAQSQPWPRAQDASISSDGSLRLRKGKHELFLTADEVSGLFDLLALALPDGPRRDDARRYRRYRLAHEAALLMGARVADLAHQTLQLLDHAREPIEGDRPLSQAVSDSQPRSMSSGAPEDHDRPEEAGFVPQVRAR